MFAADIRILSAFLCQELRAVRHRLEAVESSVQTPARQGLLYEEPTTSSPILHPLTPISSAEKEEANRLKYHITDLVRRSLHTPDEFNAFEAEMVGNDNRRDALATELEKIIDGHDVSSLVRNCFNRVTHVKLRRQMNISGRHFKCRAIPSELFNLLCAVARKRFDKVTYGQVKAQISNCLGNSHGDEKRLLTRLEKQGQPTESPSDQSTESVRHQSYHHRKDSTRKTNLTTKFSKKVPRPLPSLPSMTRMSSTDSDGAPLIPEPVTPVSSCAVTFALQEGTSAAGLNETVVTGLASSPENSEAEAG